MDTKKLYMGWKQGQTTEAEYRNTSSACRDGVRKSKGQLELTLPRDFKSFPSFTFHQGSPFFPPSHFHQAQVSEL